MAAAMPLLLVGRRPDLLQAFRADPAAPRYRLTIADADQVDPAQVAGKYRLIFVEVGSARKELRWARALRAAGPVEFVALLEEEAQAMDALHSGALDWLVWPPPDPAELHRLVARCLDQVGPIESETITSLGSYRVIRRLGRGGMADVFLAQAEGGADPVVLKRLLPQLSSDRSYAEMFAHEARISVLLDHPNVVRVIDFGSDPGEGLFLAMEYVPGASLERIGRALGWRRDVTTAAFIAAEVAAGLAHAHELRDGEGRPLSIVHRDVNPPNVLISEEGAVKLTDFGIAKTALSTSHTVFGTVRGKVAYLSPEQVVGRPPLDHRSDIFSLGSLLYLLLCGAHPFEARTPLQTLDRIREARCDPPSARDPSLPGPLEDLTMRALARDRERRWPSARELEAALRGFLETRPPVDRSGLAALAREAAQARGLPDGSGSVKVLPVPGNGTTTQPRARPPLERVQRATAAREDPTVLRGAESTVLRDADRPSVTSVSTSPALAPVPASPLDVPTVSRETTGSDETVPAAPPLPGRRTEVGPRRPEPTSDSLFPRRTRGWPLSLRVAVPLLLMAAAAALYQLLSPAPRPSASITFVPPPRERPHPPLASPSSGPLQALAPTAPPPTHPVAVPLSGPRPLPGATAPPPRPTAPTPHGTLTIWVSDGWASVALDGRALGVNAPVMGLDVAAGRHRVTLSNSSGFRRDYEVSVQGGREARLNVSLEGGK